MVAAAVIRASNSRLPSHLVAVFVGATSGIGEYNLKAFAKHCPSPRAYFIGRSQPAATRILSELKVLNPAGEYTFIQGDISLLKKVDEVCEEIKSKEKSINILVLSQGTLVMGVDTAEGIHLPAALCMYSRLRFIVNLLPLLQAAPTLRRVVSIFTGSKEGPILSTDWQARNLNGSLIKLRAQGATMHTLALEKIAEKAPDVAFVHDYPGAVRSNIAREGTWAIKLLGMVVKIFAPLICVPNEVSGERHLYLETSAAYPAKVGGNDGVAMEEGDQAAKGIEGKLGSGQYSCDQVCDAASDTVVQVLKQARAEGKDKELWEEVQKQFLRITGKVSI
ncbi:hypothetical protein P154DRAFT_522688 [Amniculicola lignicola CBS 123094]|uniref:NAD(P)-binding protein n=1 Tax=Amniculicola lignicola CBS 123094 TaxID=1392246 RepID=A0A6A5WHA8_9PLEO|nr:hypothetical protein P154DRAFT_522688 [Amniculicola lignicola CBS 123094]